MITETPVAQNGYMFACDMMLMNNMEIDGTNINWLKSFLLVLFMACNTTGTLKSSIKIPSNITTSICFATHFFLPPSPPWNFSPLPSTIHVKLSKHSLFHHVLSRARIKIPLSLLISFTLLFLPKHYRLIFVTR
jgi:hypothetical protein